MKCRALLLLASLALAGAEVARVEMEGEETCQLCVDLVGAVEEWVEAGDTIDQIVEKVEQICQDQGILTSICESLVESWLPIIIHDVIEQFLPPCAICYGLRLCETSAEDCVQGATTPDSEKRKILYKKISHVTSALQTTGFTSRPRWTGAACSPWSRTTTTCGWRTSTAAMTSSGGSRTTAASGASLTRTSASASRPTPTGASPTFRLTRG